jgi:hypothetical protein
LADAIFTDANQAHLQLAHVETFGNSLVVDVGGGRRTSCDMISGLNAASRGAGFREIVLTSGNDVKICSTSSGNWARTNTAMVIVDAQSDGVPSTPAAIDDTSMTSPSPERGDVKSRILKKASAQGIFIQSIEISNTAIELAYSNGQYRPEPEAVGRLLRILMSEAPASVETFRIASLVGYIPTLSWTFHRADIERTLENNGSAIELLPLTQMAAVDEKEPLFATPTELKFPRVFWGISPGIHQSFFDPVNPYNFAVYASVSGGVDLSPHLTLSGDVEANIYSTFSNDKRVSNSVLPHVRTDFVSYYQKGKNGIASLQASYFTKLSPDVYALSRAGYLESMFAGAGGEVLWQPPHQRWALGAALYGVQQRSFDRLFGLRDYRVVTGHVAAYYASPFYGLDFAVYAGRYLAGDYGATFEIRRHFASGIEIGAFATFTNVPFSKFGEGSFDKGFIIRIPLDFLAPINSQQNLTLDFTPLTRDGGQRLEGEQTLFYALQRGSERGMLENWNDVLQP